MCLRWWIKDLGGMSDLFLYELEDNVWDEFGESDDHIVPHPSNTHGDQSTIEGDCCKKRQSEVIGVASNADTSTKYRIQGKEKSNVPTVTNNGIMLEKGSWSHTPDGVFPSCDTDSMKEVASIASDDTRMSTHSLKSSNVESGGSDFCADDPIMGDGCTEVDNNVYRYPLSQVPQTGNDLSFFDNDNEDKENGDLLYYGWPDIGNFEDVDRMFRSCDSTFGIESLNNDEELCWFSSSNATEGSENPLKSSGSNTGSSKVVSGHHESFKPDDVGNSNNSNKNNGSVVNRMCSQSTDADDPSALGHVSFLNGLDTKSESEDTLMPKEQINLCRKLPRQQTQSEGGKKDQYLESGGSFQGYHNLKQFADMKHPLGELSSQVYSTPSMQQHKQSTGSDSISYGQRKLPYMHLEYTHHSDQISVCPTPSTKSENDGHPSPCTSNQLQSMEGSHGGSTEIPDIRMSGKRETLYNCQGFQSSFTMNFEKTASTSQMVLSGAASNQKQMQQSENQIEGHSDVEGASIEIPAELDSSNVQESSCMSSVLDDISLEATSFRQLQQVMEKLDVRTKLCIRDSLYRLARSAEQRHNCANQRGGSRDNRDVSGALMVEETNKCTGFMDMETDTNPIDRSIAHLLFHRPSDPSRVPSNDPVSLRPHVLIHESVSSPPVMGETQVFEEETTAGGEKEMLITDNR
ncbi:dentin sialophosphoprotein-like protein [Trema orientale]|uniref:Dentin sialophosphoprotein-like protein n=1 Tax=Trema orientale TaxID=63057 RepID=A0A2P5ARA3_TREOI|nr:dentin sialophosphoprotein-like protein [Trema orientale]